MKNSEYKKSINDFLLRLFTILLMTVFLAILIVTISEIFFRINGHRPQPLALRGLSATVPDRWTDWAMRPNVQVGPDYIITNGQGLHHKEEVSIAKPEEVLRVAIVGTSVVWGPGQNFQDTIPKAAEIELNSYGCNAQVINFGSMGFNLINISALMQIRVHQFQPDVVVLVTDMQSITPRWPVPISGTGAETIVKLPWGEALYMKLSEYSAFLSYVSDTARVRSSLVKIFHLPLFHPEVPVIKNMANLKPSEAGSPITEPNKNDNKKLIESYELIRTKELGAVLSAIFSFYQELKQPLYVMTPYGPFFKSSDSELDGFSLNMIAEESNIYGSKRTALEKVVNISTKVISEKTEKYNVSLINMDEASRLSDGLKNKDFSSDGIHFSSEGNRNVGKIIAKRLFKDGFCRAK
jgi:hypothetical protein